jgi:pilus assembly protein Flp/PilA
MLEEFISFLLVGRTKRDEEGATAVEYGLLVALIAAVIITVVVTLGGQINTAFSSITDNL